MGIGEKRALRFWFSDREQSKVNLQEKNKVRYSWMNRQIHSCVFDFGML